MEIIIIMLTNLSEEYWDKAHSVWYLWPGEFPYNLDNVNIIFIVQWIAWGVHIYSLHPRCILQMYTHIKGIQCNIITSRNHLAWQCGGTSGLESAAMNSNSYDMCKSIYSHSSLLGCPSSAPNQNKLKAAHTALFLP